MIRRECDVKTMTIIEALAENPRCSIRELSTKIGLNYLYVNRKIKSLISRKLISFSLNISSYVFGREASFVKIKSSNIDKLLSAMSRCNRVPVVFRINSGEVALIFISRSKEEVASFLELVKSTDKTIKSISIEHGVLPNEAMIPLKHGHLNCSIPEDCRKCLFYDEVVKQS